MSIADERREENYREIHKLAETDPVLEQLLHLYTQGNFVSWEDFLGNVVIALAGIKNALHDRLDEVAKLAIQARADETWKDQATLADAERTKDSWR